METSHENGKTKAQMALYYILGLAKISIQIWGSNASGIKKKKNGIVTLLYWIFSGLMFLKPLILRFYFSQPSTTFIYTSIQFVSTTKSFTINFQNKNRNYKKIITKNITDFTSWAFIISHTGLI